MPYKNIELRRLKQKQWREKVGISGARKKLPPLPLCRHCEKQLLRRSRQFCSNKCQAEYKYSNFIIKWKLEIQSGTTKLGLTSQFLYRYMRDTYGNKCQQCGWSEIHSITGHVPIELNHINGNSNDNSESNLELLCPNCHSLTFSFRNLNKGNGRAKRRIYYKPS